MKTKVSKKEIRNNLEAALINEIEKFEGSESSKKVKRVIRKVSKDIALRVKHEMKKKLRKAGKRLNLENNGEFNGYLIETIGEKTEHSRV